MRKIKITKPYNHPQEVGPHSYRLHPDMGEVDHLPARVCAAAVKAGCAEYVEKEKASERGEVKATK